MFLLILTRKILIRGSKDDIRCEQVRDYASRIADLKDKKEQLVKQMAELSRVRSEYQVLLSFPGIGETTAVRLIGKLVIFDASKIGNN